MTRYTCNSCGLAFQNSDDQRQHMKTEWHRYNLKRRVAQLPPISEDIFNSKVAATESIAADENADEAPLSKKEERKRAKADLLEKKRQLLLLARERMATRAGTAKISADGALVVEPKSTESDEKELKQGIQKDIDTIEGDEAGLDDSQLQEKLIREKLANKVDIPLDDCLFCGRHSADLDSSVEHMSKKHGLYIPEPTYLVDKSGLIEYLGEKLGYGNVCLVCNYQGRNLEAVRQHMLAKGHCRIPYESEDEKLEVGQFYDFSSTYGEGEGEGDEGDEDDWEDVSDDGEGDGDDEDDEMTNADVADDADNMYASSYGLHLPNGMVVGHRSLARYYRQNLPPERELGEGEGTVMAAETRRGLAQQMDRQQYQTQKRVWTRAARSADLRDRRMAKFINKKPHFRDELLQ